MTFVNLGGAVAVPGVYGGGLVADAGVTDNTAALTVLAAALPATGGTIRLPAGKIGADWTPPSGVLLLGDGNGNPTSPGTTILCGVISKSGAQVAPIQRTNPNVGLQNLTLDGGGNGAAYSCLYGLYDNAADTYHHDITIFNGTIVSWNQDASCARPTGSSVRVTNNVGGTNNPNKTQRTLTTLGTTNNSTAVTLDGSTGLFDTALNAQGVANDVGRSILSTNLPLGTLIVAVTDATHATVDQKATASSGGNNQAATVCQGEATWLNGTDNQLAILRSTNGTTRLSGGGGGQLDVLHATYTGTSTALPPNVTFDQGSWAVTTAYFDSSGLGAANVVHKQGAKQSAIANPFFFQNSANGNYCIVENDTTFSLTLNGGMLANKSGSGSNFIGVLKLAGGANTAFTWRGHFYASSASLASSGGIPALVSGGQSGPMECNFAGAYFGVGVLTVTQPAAPTATAATTPGVMAGLAIPFTPTCTGKLRFRLTGNCSTSTAAANIGITGKYGTGTAPVNGAAVSGTSFAQGNLVVRCAVAGNGAGTPFEIWGQITGLTPGTAYWIDVAFYTATAADVANLYSLQASVEETV